MFEKDKQQPTKKRRKVDELSEAPRSAARPRPTKNAVDLFQCFLKVLRKIKISPRNPDFQLNLTFKSLKSLIFTSKAKNAPLRGVKAEFMFLKA